LAKEESGKSSHDQEFEAGSGGALKKVSASCHQFPKEKNSNDDRNDPKKPIEATSQFIKPSNCDRDDDHTDARRKGKREIV